MTAKQLSEKTGWKIAAGAAKGLVTSGYVCDLLSWVIANGQPGTAWVTVQTHMNVLAVASLHDFSCVIIPDNIEISDSIIKTANEKQVTILCAPCTSYGVAKIMAGLNIGEV